MDGARVTGSLRVLAAASIAFTLTAMLTLPALAIVRFEPSSEPVPDRWVADTRIEVPWAGVSLRIPDSWEASTKEVPPSGIGSGAAVMVAFGPGDSLCLLDMYDAARVETWQDAGVAVAAELTIAGLRAERFDDMLGAGAAITSAYSVYGPRYVYSLMCSAARAPADRWHSIARTIELTEFT